MQRSVRPDPGIGSVLMLAIGVGGLAMSITLLYHGMRDVMDIGGFCAEGGPYVIEQHCPEGSIPTTLVGMLGLFLFGGLGLAGGAMVGGYGWIPIAGWTAVFAALGWNFLEYGLVNPPNGQIEWGWLIPGVLFELMAWVPAAFLVWVAWEARRYGPAGPPVRPPAPELATLAGPGQPSRPAPAAGIVVGMSATDAEARAIRRDLAADMGALIVRSAAQAPVAGAEPDLGQGEEETAFSEGTQALLDRLERLADMRDRGLLDAPEYETAKEAVMRELEARE